MASDKKKKKKGISVYFQICAYYASYGGYAMTHIFLR